MTAQYVDTHIERDLRQLVSVRDLSTFQRFLKMCAGRTGQLLNLSSLAADRGITHNTAGAWLSVLEASFIVFLLRPHFRNYRKPLVKTPKLYFCDTGLAGWLVGIREPGQLTFHAQRGALCEDLVVTEFLKVRLNCGPPPDIRFWRDSRGFEVNLLVENGEEPKPVKTKAGPREKASLMFGIYIDPSTRSSLLAFTLLRCSGIFFRASPNCSAASRSS